MVNYELGIDIIDILLAAVIIIMLAVSWYYLGFFFISFKKVPKAPKADKYTKFAVLVPARNESKVIDNIMRALYKQTYPKEFYDVWFIVEDEKDPTTTKATKRGFHYFVRDEITPQRKTKGFALQECIRYFKNNNIQYDAYMIFDADNVMEPEYLEKMNNVRQTGVQVCSGYRNFTNASTNWLTACSATLFTYMNTFTSRGRTLLFKKALLSGTGYYIDANIVDNAGGWIWTGLTEDTQLTGYCYYHDVNMRYYPRAMYYDEQSPNFKVCRLQHIRWTWGFLYKKRIFKANRKEINYHTISKYRHALAMFEYKVGMIPFVVSCILTFLLIVAALVLSIISIFDAPAYSQILFIHLIFEFLTLYSFFFVIAAITIGHERKYLKFNFATTLWACSTYCFFFLELFFAFLDGLIHPRKRHTWTPIKHTGKIDNKEAKKAAKKA